MARMTLQQLAAALDRSESTLRNWRNLGAPGFVVEENGRIMGDLVAIKTWATRNDVSKPGRKNPTAPTAPSAA